MCLPAISHCKPMPKNTRSQINGRLSQKCQEIANALEVNRECLHLQLVVGMNISSLDDCLNFAQISLHVCNWPVVGGPCERGEAESFYGLTQANPVPPADFVFPPVLAPLTNGYSDFCVFNINEAPFLQMPRVVMVICN